MMRVRVSPLYCSACFDHTRMIAESDTSEGSDAEILLSMGTMICCRHINVCHPHFPLSKSSFHIPFCRETCEWDSCIHRDARSMQKWKHHSTGHLRIERSLYTFKKHRPFHVHVFATFFSAHASTIAISNSSKHCDGYKRSRSCSSEKLFGGRRHFAPSEATAAEMTRKA